MLFQKEIPSEKITKTLLLFLPKPCFPFFYTKRGIGNYQYLSLLIRGQYPHLKHVRK